MATGPTKPPGAPNLTARLVRAVDAFYDGEGGLGVQILEDLLDELDSDRCDVCNANFSRAEALDARAQRRRGWAGACAACLDALSVRAA